MSFFFSGTAILLLVAEISLCNSETFHWQKFYDYQISFFTAALEVTGSFGPLEKNNIIKLYQKGIDLERQGNERHFDHKQPAADC